MKNALINLKRRLFPSRFCADSWSHLSHVATVHCDGPFWIEVIRCNCGVGTYLIDLQVTDPIPTTIVVIPSHELDFIIELFQKARMEIARCEHSEE